MYSPRSTCTHTASVHASCAVEMYLYFTCTCNLHAVCSLLHCFFRLCQYALVGRDELDICVKRLADQVILCALTINTPCLCLSVPAIDHTSFDNCHLVDPLFFLFFLSFSSRSLRLGRPPGTETRTKTEEKKERSEVRQKTWKLALSQDSKTFYKDGTLEGCRKGVDNWRKAAVEHEKESKAQQGQL